MKVSPKADYPVKVYHEPDERDRPAAELFDGIFTVVLNHSVTIRFIPDASALAPPWDERALPDEVTTAAQARVVAASSARYVVTPNAALRGRADEVRERVVDPFGDSYEAWRAVFYVTGEEFERYAAELPRLAALEPHRLHAETRVSALRGYQVITFIEDRVLASPLLRPEDAALLGRQPEAG